MYGLANQANAPFNSFRDTLSTLDSDNMVWFVRHRVRYLHYKILSHGATGTMRLYL
ncbi:MAG: hypothetical protein IPK16_30730 [Anaerolineales bacterium]|nr:hypothetical protein [Anaerolineales bacterium]